MNNFQYYKDKYLLSINLSLIVILFIGIVILTFRDDKSKIIAKASTTTPALLNCNISPNLLTISPEEQELYDQINQYRKINGVSPLSWSEDLTRSATWMSNDMSINNYLSHTDSLGRNVIKRISNCSFNAYASVGENIDSGSNNVQSIIQAWEHSPAQKANLLDSKFEEIGISLVTNPEKSSSYWTVNYGTKLTQPTYPPTIMIKKTPTPAIIKKPTPTLSINNKPSPTNSLLDMPSIKIPTKYISPTPSPTMISSFTPAPTIDPTFVSNPYDMQLDVQVKIMGIGINGNKNIKHQTRHLVIGLYDMTNTLVAKGTGFVTYNKVDLFTGIIHFGPILDGVYFVKIYSDFDLQAVVLPTFQTLSTTKLNIMPKVTLEQGDINSDNAIDMTDYNLALVCFQDTECTYQKIIDFNDDGIANALDYNILLHNYWATQGD